MSNNTNTLFWIITGAVIILAVFLLINNSQSESLSKISNKFDSFAEEKGIYSPEVYPMNIQGGNLGSQYILLKSCKPMHAEVEGYKVQILDAYHTTDGYRRIKSRYFVTNNNDTMSNKILEVEFYECGTDIKVSSSHVAGWTLEANSYYLFDSLGDADKVITDYYIKAVLK